MMNEPTVTVKSEKIGESFSHPIGDGISIYGEPDHYNDFGWLSTIMIEDSDGNVHSTGIRDGMVTRRDLEKNKKGHVSILKSGDNTFYIKDVGSKCGTTVVLPDKSSKKLPNWSEYSPSKAVEINEKCIYRLGPNIELEFSIPKRFTRRTEKRITIVDEKKVFTEKGYLKYQIRLKKIFPGTVYDVKINLREEESDFELKKRRPNNPFNMSTGKKSVYLFLAPKEIHLDEPMKISAVLSYPQSQSQSLRAQQTISDQIKISRPHFENGDLSSYEEWEERKRKLRIIHKNPCDFSKGQIKQKVSLLMEEIEEELEFFNIRKVHQRIKENKHFRYFHWSDDGKREYCLMMKFCGGEDRSNLEKMVVWAEKKEQIFIFRNKIEDELRKILLKDRLPEERTTRTTIVKGDFWQIQGDGKDIVEAKEREKGKWKMKVEKIRYETDLKKKAMDCKLLLIQKRMDIEERERQRYIERLDAINKRKIENEKEKREANQEIDEILKSVLKSSIHNGETKGGEGSEK